jgi:hypothetical protein
MPGVSGLACAKLTTCSYLPHVLHSIYVSRCFIYEEQLCVSWNCGVSVSLPSSRNPWALPALAAASNLCSDHVQVVVVPFMLCCADC